MPLGEKNATKALEKDNTTAEAYTSLGLVALAHDWDWPPAEQRLLKSLALSEVGKVVKH
jgi:hypothetical protein